MTKRRHLALELTGALFSLLAIWLLIAYLFLPAFWHVHFSKHPAVTNGPRITRTSSGNPGDPVNVALIASENDLVAAMLSAGWYPADPITLRSSLHIAQSTIFHRPYDDAPVSKLFLFGARRTSPLRSRWVMTPEGVIMCVFGICLQSLIQGSLTGWVQSLLTVALVSVIRLGRLRRTGLRRAQSSRRDACSTLLAHEPHFQQRLI